MSRGAVKGGHAPSQDQELKASPPFPTISTDTFTSTQSTGTFRLILMSSQQQWIEPSDWAIRATMLRLVSGGGANLETAALFYDYLDQFQDGTNGLSPGEISLTTTRKVVDTMMEERNRYENSDNLESIDVFNAMDKLFQVMNPEPVEDQTQANSSARQVYACSRILLIDISSVSPPPGITDGFHDLWDRFAGFGFQITKSTHAGKGKLRVRNMSEESLGPFVEILSSGPPQQKEMIWSDLRESFDSRAPVDFVTCKYSPSDQSWKRRDFSVLFLQPPYTHSDDSMVEPAGATHWPLHIPSEGFP